MTDLISYSNTFSTGIGAVIEALVFFWFCNPLEYTYKNKYKNIFFHILVILGFVILYYQQYSFIFQFPIMFLLMMFYIMCIKETNVKNAIFLSGVYCLLQDIAHLFSYDIARRWLMGLLFGLEAGGRDDYFNLILYTFFLILFSGMLKKNIYRNNRSQLKMKEILVSFTSVIPFAYMRTIQFSMFDKNEAVDYSLWIVLIFLALLSLFQILSNEKFLYEHIDRSEIEKMNILLEQQKERYQIKKESIDAINRNYHDLKHILLALETMNDTGEIQEYTEQLKKDIVPYERIQRTGNEVIDIQLSEKMSICNKNNIRVTPYIDGRCVNFINPLDLSIIFGNAFDNAIEATVKINDFEKKEIYIKIAEKNEMVILRFENYMDVKIEDTRNLETSKENKVCHGFGIKNIREIVSKYQGIVNIDIQDSKFCLTILIPKQRDITTKRKNKRKKELTKGKEKC